MLEVHNGKSIGQDQKAGNQLDTKPTSEHLEVESEAVPERAGKDRSSISTFSKGVGWGHGRTCPIDTSILPV